MEKANFYELELKILDAEINRLLMLRKRIENQLNHAVTLDLFPVTVDECRAKIRNILDNKTK